MNRKYFGYAGFAMLIAIYIGVHLSSATAEARWVRCLVVSRWGLTCQQSNGWGWGSSTAHVRTCPAGHRYWHCHAASRNAHAAHVAPQRTPQRTPQSTQTQTTRQTTTRQTTTRQTQSGSQSQTPQRESTPRRQQPQESCKKPTLTYKKWVIGQSATDFPSTTKPITFITDSKTRCTVKVEVSYNGSQPPNTCELTGVNFTVTMSHGFRVNGTPTVTPSGSGFSKVWKYEATFADSTDDVPANRNSSRKYAARGGTRISVTINATGTYSGGTVALSAQTVMQDEMDGLRQEYVDYNLPVLPKRKWFITRIAGRSPAGHGSYIVSPRDTNYDSSKVAGQEAFYNWGHYDYIIDSKTDHNYYVWTQWMDRLESGLKPTIITCRYRPPHHNRRWSTANYSAHQYGYALDVRGRDKSPTQRDRMHLAAINDEKREKSPGKVVDAGAGYGYALHVKPWHVHADWRPDNWDSMLASSPPVDMVDARNANTLPAISDGGGSGDDDDEDEDEDDGADGGTSTDTAPAAPAAPTTSTPTTVACGNRWRGSGACTSGGRASSRTAHRSTCGAGHSYWNCNRTAVAWHATSYTCTRSGCGLTYTKCSKGNGSCRARRPGGGTYQWHN